MPSLKPLVQKFNQKPFLKRVATVASGSLAGQAILLAVSPLLTRLYTPEDFGLLALYSSLIATGAMLTTLRYDLALHLPEKEADAFQLLQGIGVLSVVISVLLAGALYMLPHAWAAWMQVEALQPFAWLVGLGLFALGMYTALTSYATRFGAEKALAKTKVTQAIAGAAVQVGGAFLGVGSLLFGHMLTVGGGIVVLRRHARTHAAWQRLAVTKLWPLLVRYKKFPLIAAPTSFINRLSLHILPFFLTALFSPAVAGFYLLGQKLVGLPMTLVGRALAQVFFAELGRRIRQGKRDNHLFYLKILGLLLAGSLPFFVAVYPLAPWLFGAVFGEKWGEAGVYVQILLPMFWLQLAVMPLSQTLNMLERQGLQAVWDVTRLTVTIGAFGVAQMYAYDVKQTFFLLALTACSVYFLHPLLCLYALLKQRQIR